MLSQQCERGSTLVTSNLPFQEWTEVFGSERLTGALLGRLTHRVHIQTEPQFRGNLRNAAIQPELGEPAFAFVQSLGIPRPNVRLCWR